MTGRSDVPWHGYALVLAGALSYTALTFVWFSLPAYLAVIIADVDLTGTQAGMVAGAVPLTYVPLGLVSGLVVDRVGPVRSIGGGLLVFGAAQVGRSVATGFPTLLVLTLVIGVGATAITFGLPKLVGVLFPPNRIGVPTSIYLVGGAAGTATAFAVGRPVLGPALGGWRPLFLWSGVAALAYAVVWLAVARLSPVAVRTDDDRAGDEAFDLAAVRRDLRTLVTHRDLRLLVVVATTYLLVVHGVQGWLPTILEFRGLTADAAGRATGLFVVASVVAVVVVPAAADRLDARRGAVIGCGTVAFVGLATVLAGATGPLVVGGIVLAGLGAGGLSPLIRAIPPNLDDVGPRLTGTAMGLLFAVGEIGGFGGPLLVGAVFDATGSYALGLALLAAGAAVAAVAGLAMRRV